MKITDDFDDEDHHISQLPKTSSVSGLIISQSTHTLNYY